MKDIKESLVNDDSITSSAKEYASDLQSIKFDVTGFVESLGSYLTSTEVGTRANAVKLLSLTLSDLPVDFLSAVQLNFITTFYCDRLKDHHSVIPNALIGIQAMVKMTNLPDECASRVLQAIFQNVPCQSQLRPDRNAIFGIIRDLCDNKTKELLNMGADFVYGFINAMDGERDPRILLDLFEFLPKFLATFSLGHLSEEAFEVIACYFPIDFTPMTSESMTITRDMLAEKLATSLCAHESFAEDCINLLVEKLDSQLTLAKLDSLFLLSKASQSFAASEIDKLFPLIWKALKAEILPGVSKEITLAALDTLQILLVAISKDENAERNVLTEILSSTVMPLSDVDSRLFMPSAAIILKCVETNKVSAEVVTMKCLPAFLLQINKDKAEKQIQRGTLIELSAQLLSTCIRNEVIVKIDEKLIETAQFEFINCLVNHSIDNEKLIDIALQALAITAEIVVDSNRVLIYKAVNTYLLEAETIDTSSIDCRKVLTAFAARYPDEVSREIVNPILNVDFIAGKMSSAGIAELFEILTCLIAIRKFREEILEFLLHNIFDDNDALKPELRNQIRLIGVRVVHHILDDDLNEQLHEEMFTKYAIFDRFLTFIRSEHLNLANADRLTEIDDFLYEMSQIQRIIMKDLDAEHQTQIVEKYLPSLNLQHKNDLYFAAGVLGYLKSSVDLENHFDGLVTELTQLALNHDDEKLADVSNQLLCSLFNRCPDNDFHSNILKKVIELIKNELLKHNKKAVKVLSWISKGLLARGHKQASEIVDTLIELLEHPTLSEAAVAAFDIISIECPELHLPTIKHLFQQKFFQMCLKGLWHKLESYSEKHVSAFVYVLKLTPHQVLKNNIQKIGPVLLKCLNQQSTKPLTAGLTIVKRFVTEQNEFFRDHLQDLIPKCIKLSTFLDSMMIRIASIEILSGLTRYSSFTILPYAQDVLFGLQPALDDRKRLVRNAAVLARNQWFLVGSDN